MSKVMREISVHADWDSNAKVWFIKNSNIDGLHCEAATLPALLEVIMDVLPDLLEQGEPYIRNLPFTFHAPQSMAHC